MLYVHDEVYQTKNKTEKSSFEYYQNFKQMYCVADFFHPGKDIFIVIHLFIAGGYSFLHKNFQNLQRRFLEFIFEFNHKSWLKGIYNFYALSYYSVNVCSFYLLYNYFKW